MNIDGIDIDCTNSITCCDIIEKVKVNISIIFWFSYDCRFLFKEFIRSLSFKILLEKEFSNTLVVKRFYLVCHDF